LEIEIIRFKFPDGTKIKTKPHKIGTLKPNEKIPLTPWNKNDMNGEISIFRMLTSHFRNPRVKDMEIEFSLQDIEGRLYEQVNIEGRIYKQGVVRLKK